MGTLSGVGQAQTRHFMTRNSTAFVFPGIGTQWPGMGAALRAAASGLPGITETLAALDREFVSQAGWPVTSLLDNQPEHLDTRPAAAHAAIFAVQAALLGGLQRHGIAAQAALGHSSGEVGAALAAGALDLRQAVQVVLAHCALIDATSRGAMLHIDIAPEALPGWLARAQLAR